MLNYSPNYLDSAQAILKTHSALLKSLIGKPLTESWVLWELNEDEWFNDAPVVLDFDGTRLELNFCKMDELSITVNTIDLMHKPDWYGISSFDLRWHKDALGELVSVKGSYLQKLAVSEFLFETTVLQNPNYPDLIGQKNACWLLNGLSFWFDNKQHVSVFNGLDENGVSSNYLEGNNYRYHEIAV